MPAVLTPPTRPSDLAALWDRWQLAADAVDGHADRCWCIDDPCDEALRLADDEMLAWDRFELVLGR